MNYKKYIPELEMAQFSAYEPPKWDTYKEIIAELYEKNELKDVKRIMKDCYNFKASENQYKKQISKWKLNKKHIKADEYKAMLRKKRKRGEEEGKETKFVLHGHQVADESVLRFQERMTKSGKIKEEDTFSDISTPGSLACFTPSPSLNTSLTTLHIPSRLNVIRTDDSPGFEKNRFFSPVNLLDYLADTNLMTSYSDTTPPGININRLVEEVLRFGRLPDGEKEAKFLDFVISLNADCDELCSQCPPFGYDSGSAGCLIHRSLSYILAQYDREAWSATKATLLCREIIADASAMLRPGYAPLASLLRIAIDIVYLFARTGSMDDIQCLAVDILGISSRFLHEDQYTYRALLAICAHILAQNGHCKTAVSTLKSVLGTGFGGLVNNMYRLGTQFCSPSILTFDRAVMELTAGRVRAFDSNTGWKFFDYDAQDHYPLAWYRDSYGRIRKEELFVRGIALQALVEIEHQFYST